MIFTQMYYCSHLLTDHVITKAKKINENTVAVMVERFIMLKPKPPKSTRSSGLPLLGAKDSSPQ
jgi:hypothetical protein